MLQEVVDLQAQVAASVAAEAAAVTKLQGLEAQVATLQTELTTAQAAAISDADKAALVQAKTDLATSQASLAAA